MDGRGGAGWGGAGGPVGGRASARAGGNSWRWRQGLAARLGFELLLGGLQRGLDAPLRLLLRAQRLLLLLDELTGHAAGHLLRRDQERPQIPHEAGAVRVEEASECELHLLGVNLGALERALDVPGHHIVIVAQKLGHLLGDPR